MNRREFIAASVAAACAPAAAWSLPHIGVDWAKPGAECTVVHLDGCPWPAEAYAINRIPSMDAIIAAKEARVTISDAETRRAVEAMTKYLLSNAA